MGHFYSYITRAPPGNSDILPRAKATASENAVAAAEIPKDHNNGSPRKSISTDTAVVGALDRILINAPPKAPEINQSVFTTRNNLERGNPRNLQAS